MNDPDPHSLAGLKRQIADLSLAVKIGFFALLLGASYFDIRATYYIPRFKQIFNDMLGGGTQIPANTAFAIQMREPLMALACALPAIGIIALFAKSARNSVIALSVCALAAVAQYVFTWWALVSPLVEIIKKMASGGDS